MGVDLAPSTIVTYVYRCLELMRPLYQAMWEECRKQKHWHIDETTWRVFVEHEGKQGYRWWVWIWTNEKMTLFVLDPTRSADVPSTWMEGSKGICAVSRPFVAKQR
jgi:transposase